MKTKQQRVKPATLELARKVVAELNVIKAAHNEKPILMADFIDECVSKANSEHELIKESVIKQGLGSLEAEIKFREFWGL